MTCDDSRELLVEYVLGHLEASRANEVREHLQGGCEMCAREMSEVNAAWARMAASLEPVEPSPEVESKLLRMIRGEIFPAAPIHREVNAARRHRIHTSLYVLAASLAGVLAGTLALRLTPLGSILASGRQSTDAVETWGAVHDQKDLAGFQTVALNTIAEKRGIRVSVVVTPQNKEWHVLATGLPSLQAEEQYQLWIENKSGEIRKSAKIPIDDAGRGGIVIDMALTKLAELKGLWLTLEKSPDATVPSENVLFRGLLK